MFVCACAGLYTDWVHVHVCPCWYANHPIPLCSPLKKASLPQTPRENKLETGRPSKMHTELEERQRETGVIGLIHIMSLT